MIRRDFLKKTTMGALAIPCTTSMHAIPKRRKNIGVQLYSVRVEMNQDAKGTLAKLAKLGYNQIESFRSNKGLFCGLSPKEMNQTCRDLGMTLRSGHCHVDQDWKKTLHDAAESGMEYLICSSMPTNGQTLSNYKEVSDTFNKVGEEAKKSGIKFGYHNHASEFDADAGQILYDVLLQNTDPKYVHMELDLGWVYAAGKDPLAYIQKYQGRFPLWHLKDMNLAEKKSTEFGQGGLPVQKILEAYKISGLKYFFIEQEEYGKSAFDSLEYDINYYKKLVW